VLIVFHHIWDSLSIFDKTTRIIVCFHFQQSNLCLKQEKEINVTVVEWIVNESWGDGKLFLCLPLSVLFFLGCRQFILLSFLCRSTYAFCFLYPSLFLSFACVSFRALACVLFCTHTTVFSHVILIPIIRSDCTLASLARSNTLECTH